MNCNWERTQHGEEVMAVLCYLVTAIRGSTTFNTMMAKPRVQSLGHDAPPSPPSPSPRPLRDADGGWRCRSLCTSLCSFASLRFVPFPHEQLDSVLYSSKPSACLLSSLSPTFEVHSKDRHILLQMIHPVFLFPPWVALTPNKLPRHHALWQTLLPHTCHEFRKQNPPFAHYYRLNALGICLGKRVGVRYGVVVALPFPPSKASERRMERWTRRSLS